MNSAANFKANGSLNDERVSSEPLNAHDALERAVQMKLDGYRLITLTDIESGHEFDIERFMTGNPSGQQ